MQEINTMSLAEDLSEKYRHSLEREMIARHRLQNLGLENTSQRREYISVINTEQTIKTEIEKVAISLNLILNI